MTDQNRPTTTYSEDVHLAVLAERVKAETAALTESVTAKDAEIAQLKTSLDTAEASAVSEKARADKAEADLADYKAAQDKAAETARLRGERTDAVKALGLDASFVTDEKAARWAEMPETAFAGFLDDLKAVVKPDAAAAAKAETAAFTGGTTPTAPAAKGSNAARMFAAARSSK